MRTVLRAIFIVLFGFSAFAQGEITVTGVGANLNEAKTNAFKNAVEQVIGVLISTELIIKNGELIEENIKTKSQGFVEKYDVSSTSMKNGLFEVTIRAVVSQAELAKELEIITGTKINLDGKNVVASVQTKKVTFDDLLKEFPAFLQELDVELQSSYKVEILSVDFNYKKAVKDVPFIISVDHVIDYNKYDIAIKKFEDMLLQLGAKSRDDEPNNDRLEDIKTARVLTQGKKDEGNSIILIARFVDQPKYEFYSMVDYEPRKYEVSNEVRKPLDSFFSNLKKKRKGMLVIKFMENETLLKQFTYSSALYAVFYNNADFCGSFSCGSSYPTLKPIFYGEWGKELQTTFTGEIDMGLLEKVTSVIAETKY
jgi:hypothetical protein